MADQHIVKGIIFEDSTCTTLARILNEDGNAITQSAISSIACNVYDLNDTDGSATLTPSITISDVIFDSLQTDSIWQVDGSGYNFKNSVSYSAFTDSDTTYAIEYKFTLTSAAQFYVVFHAQTLKIRSS